MIPKALPCLLAIPLVAALSATVPMVSKPLAAQTTAQTTNQTAAPAAAPSVDELVEKNLQAKGGREKLKAIRSLRMTGKMTMPQGMEGGLVIEIERPDKLRSDFTLQGLTMTQAYDGKNGWKVVPFTGKTDPEAMTDMELKHVRQQAMDIDGLMDYKQRGETLEYLGEADLEGTPVHKLKLIRKDGEPTTIYLDAEHFLEIRTDGKAPVQGQEVETSSTFGDYKEAGGILFSHSWQISVPGGMGAMTMTFDKIEVNPDIPDARFAMPAKTAMAAPKE